MTEEKKKARQTIHVAATGRFRLMLEEISSEEGISMAEVVRKVVSEYYYETFRRRKFGYQGGMTSGKARVAKAGIQAHLDAIDKMTDPELTTYIHEIGLISADDAAFGTYEAHTNENGLRTIKLTSPDGSSRSDRWDMQDLKKELGRYLKAQAKNVS